MEEYRSNDWRNFAVDWRGAPYPVLESEAQEREAVGKALDALIQYEAISGHEYDERLFLAYRKTMLEKFQIPWTGIGRRVQRLLYALNAIEKPDVMVAAGVFCGNTYICNAGAAVGPGACYKAQRLVGIEIETDPAGLAAENLEQFEVHDQRDPRSIAQVLQARGLEAVFKDWDTNYGCKGTE